MKKSKIPHIELHCHLDGSLRVSTIINIAKKENIELPSLDVDDITSRVTAPTTCDSLETYLESFDIPIKVMQSKESLKRVAYELYEDAANENVKYLEVRFAPQFHTQKGLSLKEVIESVIKGIAHAESEYEIKGNIILCCMRHLSEEKAIELIEAGKEFLGNGVVGIDLAGAESEGFCKKYINAFKLAKEYGYKITVHAGETAISQNVIDAINLLGAERIGHGVFISEDSEAYNLVKSKRIALEMCATSNVQTKAIPDFSTHPFNSFLKDGMVVTINTDNRTVSDTTMLHELRLLVNTFRLTIPEYIKIFNETIDASFADDETKNWLRTFI